MSPYRISETLAPEAPALPVPERESEPPDASVESLVIVRPSARGDEGHDVVPTAVLVAGLFSGVVYAVILMILH